MIETRGIAARLRRGIGVLLPVLFLSFCASAQTDNTQVSGFVKDASGAVVPEATVTARSEATGAERTVKTNSEGYYVITPLAPGLYTITAQQAGFKKFELTHRKLDPSAPANADIVLEIGTQSEAVTVEAQATNLDTGSAAITRLIERKTIEMTELNGRNPVMLALLKTGVTNASFALPDFIPSMTTGQFNINGSRSQSNAIMFDGAVGIRTRSNDTWSIGAADVGQTQEVQILTANYNAEYGRAAGGQIRVVSKTGTRRLHGEAYEYVRNPAFNANDWSRNANPQPGDCNTNPGLSQCRPGPFRFNQFGWNLNGPVPKTRDKVFWSYSQEWMRLRSPQNATGKVPTDRMRTGDFGEFLVPSQFGAARILKDPLTCDSNGANCANFPGNVIPENRLSANGKALLNAYPAAIPGYQGPSGQNWFASRTGGRGGGGDSFSVDYYVTDRNQILWRGQVFGVDRWDDFPYGNDVGYTPRNWHLPNKWSSLNWISTISPTFINEAFVTASADHVSTEIRKSPYATWSRSGFGINYPYIYPGKDLDKIPTVTGLSPFLDLNGGPYPSSSAGPIITIADNVTKIHDNHSLKFGVNYEHSGENDFDQINISATSITNNQNGQFQFAGGTPGGTGFGAANAAIGLFDTYAEIGQRAYTPYRSQMFEWFAQDSWKVTQKLRLEIGVRHSIIQPYYSLWGNMAVFAPQFYDPSHAATVDPVTGAVTGDLQATLNGMVIPGDGWPSAAKGRVALASDPAYNFLFRKGIGKSFADTHWANFQPRFGVAYSLDSKTVLRAGVGRFMDRIGVSDSIFLGGNPPFQPTTTTTRGSVDNPAGGAQTVYPLGATTEDGSLPNPEAYTWNVTVQREIGFNTVLEVGYVGRRSLHLQQERNLNELPVGTCIQGNCPGGANPDALRPFRGWGEIRTTENVANSKYNSLQLSLEKRFSRGLSYGVAYTYGSSKDNGSGQRDVLPIGNDRSYMWGPSDFDIRHNLVINTVYELPFLRTGKGIMPRLLGGWTVSGVLSWRTGTPFSITDPYGIDYAGNAGNLGEVSQYWLLQGPVSYPAQYSQCQDGVCNDARFLTATFAAPADGTYAKGNVRNILRRPHSQNLNFGLFKDFKVSPEGQHYVQFRFETFNTLNHPNWDDPNMDPSDQVGFGRVTSKTGNRQLQLALRYAF